VSVRIAGGMASAVYDPPANECLRTIICDRCLVAKGAKGLLRRETTVVQHPEVRSSVWLPDGR